VLGGIESELVQRRISVLLSSLALSGAFDTAQVMAWMSEQRIDALLLARPGKRERPLVEAAARAGLPIALIGPDEDFGEGHVVRSLNREAGREVGQHLFALGHQRVAFVGGPECSIDTRDRLAGLRKGLAEHDLELAPPSVQFSSSYDPEAGMAYADHWLEQPQSRVPTAVVFGNDALAHGFMRAVQQEGIVVPRDVSVVGFDDVPESALTWPGLTTSRQQSRAMGAAACRAVVRQIDNPSPRETTLLEFPTELVVRESTGAAPAYGRKTLLQAR
jgi:DNA-binding LacI/PurR family transcriptional regulator